MIKDLSTIQNHILSTLKNAKSLRYTDLRPDKISNDLFNYHLKFLLNKGLVNKLERGYELSERGIKHIADPYPQNNALTSLFKINVITIVSRRNNGETEILSQVRKSNPSYGKIGVMGGVVLKGELIEHAATRKLKQETGLDANFKLIGCERRIMYKGEGLFSDVLFPICYSSKSSGELVNTKFGDNLWLPINKAIKNESVTYDSIKSIVKVLRAIKKQSVKELLFFFEEVVQNEI